MSAADLLAVRAGRACDPVDGVAQDGPAAVLVRRSTGRIVDVVGAASVPAGVEVLDHGPGATILPGLVDAHTHLCFDPDGDLTAQMTTDPDEVVLARAAAAARCALAAGITTVRDLGDRGYLTLALRERLRQRPADGPELLVAGPPITRTRGHCWFLGGAADGVEELARAVAERASRGVDVVKIMATGGMLTPGFGMHESQYRRAELAVLVRAAHRVGLPVIAHAHGPGGIADAVAAGVDGVEHVTFVTADGVDCDPAFVDRLAASGIVAGCNEAWLPSAEPFPPAAAARVEEVWRNVVRMHAAGVRLVLSSDAGVGPRKPHDVLPHGAVLLDRLGVPRRDVLAMVTSAAARACGLEARKGRLQPGYDADLLVVDGDPLAETGALLRPCTVVRAGVSLDSRCGS